MVSSSPVGHTSFALVCVHPPALRLPFTSDSEAALPAPQFFAPLVSSPPPSSGRRAFPWAPMEQPKIEFCSAEMAQTGLYLGPVQQAEQELEGLFDDLQLSLASGTTCGLQMDNYLERDDDAVWILQILEGPQDEADLDERLSGGLRQSPLWDTVSHHQMEHRRSGRRGTRKRRISPWDTFIFRGTPLGRGRKNITRKNNSRWTPQEVKLLIQGVSKFGVGRWSKLKTKYFKTSVRTAVHLKDKWRNLLRAYQENVQKYILLDLEPRLVEQIRKLAVKHPYPKQRQS